MSYLPFPDIFNAHQKMRARLAAAQLMLHDASNLATQHKVGWVIICQVILDIFPHVANSFGIQKEDDAFYRLVDDICMLGNIQAFETYCDKLLADVKASDPLDTYQVLGLGEPIDELNNMRPDWDEIGN